jgi:hypothetical protein
MPSFRDRPLTWLFFIAAACLAVADLTQSDQQTLAACILSAIVYIAGAWAAVSKTHRLARGAAMFIAPLAAAMPIYIIAPHSGEASAVLAMTLVASAVAYASALVTSLFVVATLPRAKSGHVGHWWRFSLSEILGWTVVTAIASVAVSKAEIPSGMDWELIWTFVTSPIPCGVMIALFLVPQPRYDRAATIISCIVITLWYALTAIVQKNSGYYSVEIDEPLLGLGIGLIALWLLCMRLDESALDAKHGGRRPPALKIHDESSDDE